MNAANQAERVIDVDGLSDKPYWVSFDPNHEVAFVSIPSSGTVQAYGIGEGCSAPL